MTTRANRAVVGSHRRKFILQNRSSPVKVRLKQMEPDLEGVEAGSRIEACHVFFRKETRDAIGVKFGLGDVRLNSVIESPEYNNSVVLLFHKFVRLTTGF